MTAASRILLADPDLEASRALSRALRQRGFQVYYAPDGSRALEVSVLRHPDLVLYDDNCTLLDARTFVRILRSNPRTAEIPVVITTTLNEADRLRGLGDGCLRKPFNLDEVLARIDQLFRRAEAAQDLKGESKEIEGSLAQLALPDLLQVLSMNRRTGRLELGRGLDRGEILLAEGRVVSARAGMVESQKALYRLLGWSEGSFAFVPGPPPLRQRFVLSMDEVLLEGMRHVDETAHILGKLPPRSARLELSPSTDLPKDQHPVTAQVVELLRVPRSLNEILDLTTATDLDALAAIRTLIEKGVARLAEESNETTPPLLTPAEVHALRTRLFRARATGLHAVAKVLLAGQGASSARRLLTGLPGAIPFGNPPPAVQSGFGTVARFEVSEALEVHFLLVPAAEAARPLWRPFCAGAVGGLVLDSSEVALRLARFFAWEARVPVAMVGKSVPDVLNGAPAGATAVEGHLAEALRTVLVQNLMPVSASVAG